MLVALLLLAACAEGAPRGVSPHAPVDDASATSPG
jgi:hypothetical protein